mmetsp:Transcript_31015/g.47920  ORF Transcript_31015/g.47920 Transcript_31015/m.47920 type:complete len:222 (+) Transcript_31015:345-1010(+)
MRKRNMTLTLVVARPRCLHVERWKAVSLGCRCEQLWPEGQPHPCFCASGGAAQSDNRSLAQRLYAGGLPGHQQPNSSVLLQGWCTKLLSNRQPEQLQCAEDSQSSPVLISACHGVRHNKKTDSVDITVMQEDSHRSSSPISKCWLVPQNGAAGAESYKKSSSQTKRLDNTARQEDSALAPPAATAALESEAVRSSALVIGSSGVCSGARGLRGRASRSSTH